MRQVQDPLRSNIPGVYKIPYMCGEYYIGQSGRSIVIRQKEHQWHLRLENTEKSAFHGWDTGHIVQFPDTEVYRSKSWGTRVIMKSLKISLRSKTINKEMVQNSAWHGSLPMNH